MKKILFILILACIPAVAGDYKDIEVLQDYDTVKINSSYDLYFSRWHDKQSGVEFICAQSSRWNNDAGVSCFTTGRKW